MALFKKTQKIENSKMYQAHFNQYNQIELCEVNAQTGLALVLVERFVDTFDLNKWTRENKVSSNRIVWGNENENASIEMSRKYAL